ncbi:unnamed protein product [Linum trigynum]|uniref:Uncharacterized protein n=1 Tax=Linum trigynum TaxID=586398 RepID=A0AAV2DZW5_9ROSI
MPTTKSPFPVTRQRLDALIDYQLHSSPSRRSLPRHRPGPIPCFPSHASSAKERPKFNPPALHQFSLISPPPALPSPTNRLPIIDGNREINGDLPIATELPKPKFEGPNRRGTWSLEKADMILVGVMAMDGVNHVFVKNRYSRDFC